MKIAVSVETKDGLESIVAHHFGRCPYFALVEVEGCDVGGVEVIDNPYYGAHQPGQVPGFIHQHSADVMLSGGMGARAIRFFEQYGIKTATGASGTVRSALQNYLGGELNRATPCRESIEHGHGGHDHQPTS